MSDYDDDTYGDESFEESSPVKGKAATPRSPPQSPPPSPPAVERAASNAQSQNHQSNDRSSHKSSQHSSPESTPRRSRSSGSRTNSSRSSSRGNSKRSGPLPNVASPETVESQQQQRPRGASNSQSVEPTPRDFNWLRPTPKTPPVSQGHQSQPPSRHSPTRKGERSPSRDGSPVSSRSRSRSSGRSNSSHYSSPFSSAAPSPQKEGSSHNSVPHLPAVKPTSAPAQVSHRTSSSRDSGHRSNPEPRSPPPKKNPKKQQQDAAPPAKVTTNGFQSAQEPTSVQEINLLRLKNAELQRAIDDARSQLYKLAPRMSVFKVKRRTDEERLKKLQSEAQVLAQDYEVLSRRAREANHVKMLEKNIVAREEEIKKLTERNKYLQVEIRNNTRRLKHNENIDEQRKSLLEGLRNERVIAQGNLERAKKEAESAAQSRESLAQRLSELEAKDKLRDMPMEDVKRIIDLRSTLVERDEAIANMQHRLQILKRASDSSALAKHASGIPAQGGGTTNDLTAIEMLKEEIASLRFKLDAHAAQTADEKTTNAVKGRRQVAKEQQQQQAEAVAAAAAAATESPARESWAQQGKSKPSAAAPSKKQPAAAGRRTNSAEPAAPAAPAGPAPAGSGAAAAKKGAVPKGGKNVSELPPRSESVPPIPSSNAVGSDDEQDVKSKLPPKGKASSSSSLPVPTKKQSKAALAIAEVRQTSPNESSVKSTTSPTKPTSPAQPDDDTPPWMMEEVTPKKSEKALKQLSASSSLTRDPSQSASSRVSPTNRVISPTAARVSPTEKRVSPTRVSPKAVTLQQPSDDQPEWLTGGTSPAASPEKPAPAAAVAKASATSSSAPTPARSVSPPPPAAAAPTVAPPAEVAKKSDEPAWLFDE
ncbi:unnamed protein product [Bodo saltans]|uniref:Lebercilin domain-containing protein n=1 Tax=Bodo saltans TaxID=75058 RepID=A0A0S4JUW8_BODSA|nr:unnamed protein product [Bodo saltans]|eukprot:CUG94210.1 unnamed protein product [Bodo saltans]